MYSFTYTHPYYYPQYSQYYNTPSEFYGSNFTICQTLDHLFPPDDVICKLADELDTNFDSFLSHNSNQTNINKINIKKFNFKKQTRDLGNNIRISSLNPSNELISHLDDNVRTLYDLFKQGESVSNDGPLYGWKPSEDQPFKWMSYSQARREITEIGSGLINLGLDPMNQQMVGIYAKNRPEWVITENACNFYSFISVPLYDTLGEEAISFILNQTQLRVVVCDDSKKCLSLLKNKSHLRVIVTCEPVNDKLVIEKAKKANVHLITFDKLKQIGKRQVQYHMPPSPDDIYTICYTSGTTGQPKGVVLTHSNMINVMLTAHFQIKIAGGLVNGQEVHLSYLPLAHMFERVAQSFMISIGGRIGFYQGDVKKLAQDIKELKPTFLCSVPRILNRFKAQIEMMIKQAPAEKQAIFKKAYDMKQELINKGESSRSIGQLELAFKEIRENFGGRLKVIVTGSAPISGEVLQFFKVVTGCHVLEGYGSTETCGVSTFQMPGDSTVGHVGIPLLGSLVKLADVPELGLNAKRDKKGEVLVKGVNIFKGYYKDPVKTKEVLDDDGWYRTGDIGQFDSNECLKIVDRVKHIFKLAQGEYIAPEKIENTYLSCSLISQIFVDGNSLKSSLVAVVVPEELAVLAWAKQNSLTADMKTLCKSDQLKQVILAQMNQAAKERGLKGFEQVKDVYLHPELFSIENNLLTTTLKSKRSELRSYFKQQLDDMYKKLD